MSPIIEAAELLKIYQNRDVLIFDVSNGNDSKVKYEFEHLEGAIFVDLNTQLADIKTDLSQGGRHPLPELQSFARTLSELGISPESHVVIYDDNNGSNAAARFWWMLKAVGHEKAQVLNGGLTEAKKSGFPLSSKTERFVPCSATYPTDNWQLPIVEMQEVEQVSQLENWKVVDVRSSERYAGKTEPIDLIAGHIPGAVNVPFTENLDGNGLFLKPVELKAKYEAIFDGIDPENRIIHCGSGVTACHTLLAMTYAGLEIPKLYVGSWSEWSRNDKPIGKSISQNL